MNKTALTIQTRHFCNSKARFSYARINRFESSESSHAIYPNNSDSNIIVSSLKGISVSQLFLEGDINIALFKVHLLKHNFCNFMFHPFKLVHTTFYS